MKKRQRRRRIDPQTIHIFKQIGIGILVISFLTLLVYGIWHVTRANQFTIRNIEVRGGQTISHAQVEEKVWEQLQGTYIRLIPRVFTYTYPHDDIVSSLYEIERIKDIKVSRSGRNKLEVNFGEYVPFALWCEEVEMTPCTFLDKEGYAFSKAPDLKGRRLHRFEFIGKSPSVQEHFIESDSFYELNSLLALLADSGWFSVGAAVDAANDAYIYLAGGGELKVSLNQSPAETMNNLVTVLDADEFSHITPDNFKYIDLRFGNKVFVNEVFETPDIATTSEPAASTTLQSEE